MVTILGSAWFPAKPAWVKVRELAENVAAGYEPIIGVVLVRVDPPGELKAYIGIADGRNQAADEDFIADWGGHFPVQFARRLVNPVAERTKESQREPVPLSTDPERETVADCHATGIYVRARNSAGDWCNADIAQLERGSLLAWLRRDRGNNPIAERTVLLLLGHEPSSPDEFAIELALATERGGR